MDLIPIVRAKSLAGQSDRWVALFLGVLLSLRLFQAITSPDGLYWDFSNFYNTGSRIYHGEFENIYRRDSLIAGQPRALITRLEYVGFPLSAILFAPLGAFAPVTGLLVFKISCAVSLALGLWIFCKVFTKWASGNFSRSALLLMILFYEPMWRVFDLGGQATAMAFLFLVAGHWFFVDGRFLPASVFLSIAILLKPFLGLSLLVFVFAAEWRFLGRLLLSLSVEAVLSLVLLGWELHLEWIRIVLQESSRWAVPWWQNCSILSFFGNFWLYLGNWGAWPPPWPVPLRILQGILQGMLLLVFVVLLRRKAVRALPTFERRFCCWSLAVLFSLCFPAIVWVHYLVFLIPWLLTLILRFEHLPRALQIGTLLIIVFTLRGNLALSNLLFRPLGVLSTFPEVLLASIWGCTALILSALFVCLYPNPLEARNGAVRT